MTVKELRARLLMYDPDYEVRMMQYPDHGYHYTESMEIKDLELGAVMDGNGEITERVVELL